MIYYAHIIKWNKTDQDSPGYLVSSLLYAALSDIKSVIPAKFGITIEDINAYAPLLKEIEYFTGSFNGIINIVQTTNGSVFLFDTLENLNRFKEERCYLNNWTKYEVARDTFLTKIGVSFQVNSPVAVEIANMEDIYYTCINLLSN
jgi:hypothetical protein